MATRASPNHESRSRHDRFPHPGPLPEGEGEQGVRYATFTLKLDENIGRRGQELLRAAGHNVATVCDQGMSGAADEKLFRACAEEERALITLDHDFCHVLRFPPEQAAGIVVLELPPRAAAEALLNRLREFLKLLETRPLKNELWIIEPGRVRVHQREE